MAILLFFLYLLLFPSASIAGAKSGLQLWYQTVLPVLFPFLFLCSVIVSLNLLDPVLNFLHKPFHLIFHCSKYGTFAILSGFLCGFPIGARITSELYHHKKLSREETIVLYGFINNLSPGFLLSYASAVLVPPKQNRWILLLIVYSSSLLCGYIHFRLHPIPKHSLDTSSQKVSSTLSLHKILLAIESGITSSIHAIVHLGAYIILFSILTTGLEQLLPKQACIMKIPLLFLEVTKGISLLQQLPLTEAPKLILLCALCSFGGLSGIMQTITIAAMDSSTIKSYIKSRVTITLLSILISIIYLLLF